MNDRELLERAAKAAGIKGEYRSPGFGIVYIVGSDDYSYAKSWNPLTDDGDALRLAVRLFTGEEMSDIFNAVGSLKAGAERDFDSYAATRLAIVHAAAEIGKEMK